MTETTEEPKLWALVRVEKIDPVYLDFVFDFLALKGYPRDRMNLGPVDQSLWDKVSKNIMLLTEMQGVSQSVSQSVHVPPTEQMERFSKGLILDPPGIESEAFKLYSASETRTKETVRKVLELLREVSTEISKLGVVPKA